MKHETLVQMGYIYENAKTKETSLNMLRVKTAPVEYIEEEILSTLKEILSEDNYNKILLSLLEEGINVKDVSFPSKMKREEDDSIILLQEARIYDVPKIRYRFLAKYIFKNEYQKSVPASVEKQTQFLNEVEELFKKKSVDIKKIETFTKKYRKLLHDDIKITVNIKNLLLNTVEFYEYNKRGFVRYEKHLDDKLFKTEEKTPDAKRIVKYYTNGIVSKSIITDNSDLYPILIEEVFAYDENNVLSKSKVTYSQEKLEEYITLRTIAKKYEHGEVRLLKVLDSEFEDTEFLFDGDIIHIKQKEYIIEFNRKIQYIAEGMTIEALKKINVLESGLRYLQTYVNEIKLDYQKVYDGLYEQKVKIAQELIANRQVITYVADKGKTTLYNSQGERVAYFPREAWGSYYSELVKKPGVIVEQRVKSGKNQSDMEKIYWLGTQTGEKKGIYGFHRVIKALCQNENTPVRILIDIAKGILGGVYNMSYLEVLVRNKSVPADLLGYIFKNAVSVIVREAILDHPNCPEAIKSEELSGRR